MTGDHIHVLSLLVVALPLWAATASAAVAAEHAATGIAEGPAKAASEFLRAAWQRKQLQKQKQNRSLSYEDDVPLTSPPPVRQNHSDLQNKSRASEGRAQPTSATRQKRSLQQQEHDRLIKRHSVKNWPLPPSPPPILSLLRKAPSKEGETAATCSDATPDCSAAPQEREKEEQEPGQEVHEATAGEHSDKQATVPSKQHKDDKDDHEWHLQQALEKHLSKLLGREHDPQHGHSKQQEAQEEEGEWQQVRRDRQGVLLWSDEFNHPTVNLSDWNLVQGDGQGTPAGSGKGELQCYRRNHDNVHIARASGRSDTVNNGWLNITALKLGEPADCFDGPAARNTTRAWASAKLTTQGKRVFVWSNTSSIRVEARIKIPAAAGAWPVFSLLPERNTYGSWCSSGEIGIMEHVNGPATPVHGTVHHGGPWPNCSKSGGSVMVPSLTTGSYKDWHIYSVEWDERYIAFSVDGLEYSRVLRDQWWSGAARGKAGAPFDKPFYLNLNVAVGGAWPCPNGRCGSGSDAVSTSELNGPYTMLVDYVRVWSIPRTPTAPETMAPSAFYPSPVALEMPIASMVAAPAPVNDTSKCSRLSPPFGNPSSDRLPERPSVASAAYPSPVKLAPTHAAETPAPAPTPASSPSPASSKPPAGPDSVRTSSYPSPVKLAEPHHTGSPPAASTTSTTRAPADTDTQHPAESPSPAPQGEALPAESPSPAPLGDALPAESPSPASQEKVVIPAESPSPAPLNKARPAGTPPAANTPRRTPDSTPGSLSFAESPAPTPASHKPMRSPPPLHPARRVSSGVDLTQYHQCTVPTPCPRGLFFYCIKGGQATGCSAYPRPFLQGSAEAECAEQCLSLK